MTSIIEKRRSLHRSLINQKKQYDILESQMCQLQALANIGTATCMIAHEINNLLTPITNYTVLAMQNPNDRVLTQKALQKTAQNAQQACEVVKSILATINQTQEKKDVLLIDLVRETFNCLARDFTKDRISVKINVPENLQVRAIPIQIQQSLMNLILNAREAMLPNGGILTINAYCINDIIKIEVSDTGCGISPDNLENVFNPFFTTKNRKDSLIEKSGGGLGLAFCKKVIEAHNGSICVESIVGERTKFTITLPRPG